MEVRRLRNQREEDHWGGEGKNKKEKERQFEKRGRINLGKTLHGGGG